MVGVAVGAGAVVPAWVGVDGVTTGGGVVAGTVVGGVVGAVVGSVVTGGRVVATVVTGGRVVGGGVRVPTVKL